MPLRKTVSEFGIIRNATDATGGVDSFSEIFLPAPAFQQLKTLAGQENADAFLTVIWQKGREVIRVRNYVGLIETSDGTQIEIVPKIIQTESGVTSARRALLTMLRHLRNSPFKALPNAHTRTSNLPLWEIFISAFLDEVDRVVGQGLQQAYVAVEANERFWKGKFQAARHLRQNLYHAERLAVVYDKRTPNTAPNRILKTTLYRLQPRTGTLHNQARIQQLLQTFDEVHVSDNLTADWQIAHPNNRLANRYAPALRWAEALLNQQAYGIQAGSSLTLALLFPMERIFEHYVTHGFRMYWPTGEVSAQEASAHLVEEHVGSPKFRLRPDLLIRDGQQTLVLDAKWKHLNAAEKGSNYGIEAADLYQLYAYGKKYSANQLFLIYPANNTFSRPLDVFGYDAETNLHVIPFDVTQPLQQEVEKVYKLALSFQTK